MLNCTTLASKISSVDIDKVEAVLSNATFAEDDLYEVFCVVHFDNGTSERYDFACVCKWQLASLKDPSTDEAKIDIADLIEDCLTFTLIG
jgi:hypothetical protein